MSDKDSKQSCGLEVIETNCNGKNVYSKNERSKSLSISKLPLDVWSVCLQFLSPPAMVIASSCVAKATSSEYAREHAAWATLTDVICKARGLSIKLSRHPQETWTGLYRLCWSLYLDVRKGLESIDSIEKDLSTSERQETDVFQNDKITQEVFWFIFGYDDSTPSPTVTMLYADALASILHKKISQESSKWKINYRSRVQSIAMRLSDIGKWTEASHILSIIVESARKVQLDDAQEISELLTPKDSAEINICISTFLIDRLYCNTYVRRDANDSKDLSDAVICGRTAVSLCLQSQSINNDSTGARNCTTSTSLSLSRNTEMPPPISIYSSDFLRIAASRLALGRALALLAQHIGLGVTAKEDVNVRPSHNNVDFSAKTFFMEGERCLKTSIAAMTEEQEAYDSFDHLEILAATYAALGESYYCSSSVTGSASSLQNSIKYLTSSLRMVHDKLTKNHENPPTIQELCARSPRSLMMLQAQTAKDLGKVYNFSGGVSQIDNSFKILLFALVVSMQFHHQQHPILENIRRLSSRRNRRINGTNAELEEKVNHMLIDNFPPG